MQLIKLIKFLFLLQLLELILKISSAFVLEQTNVVESSALNRVKILCSAHIPNRSCLG